MADLGQQIVPRKTSALPWVALAVAALGVSAWVILNRTRSAQTQAAEEDLFDLAERAASQLDARIIAV